MSKISWKSFTSGIIVGSVLFSGISLASPAVVKLVVNGKEVRSEVPPQIIDGRTLIPARGLAEALGARVDWDAANQTVVVQTDSYRQLQSKADEGLAPQAVIYLAAQAKNHYWYASVGGGTPEGDNRMVKIPGQAYDYRWMGSDLDTKAKYIAYFEEVFTPEQAADYYKLQLENGSLVEVNGRLAQPNADGGSLMNWGGATAKLIQNSAKLRTFQFSVPLGDGDAGYEEMTVKVRYVDGVGWRLDEPVKGIR